MSREKSANNSKRTKAKVEAKAEAKPAKGAIAVVPPTFRRERALLKRGIWPVAGCDEAGRRWPGPW